MLVYRISPTQFASDLSGEGARLFGGRWNPIGISALYTAESPSLAMLETVAFYAATGPPPELVLVTIEVPDSVTIELPDLSKLSGWNARPPMQATIIYGQRWLEAGKSACLRVPSVMAPEGYAWNLVLNPLHLELAGKMKVVEVVGWRMDSRIADRF